MLPLRNSRCDASRTMTFRERAGRSGVASFIARRATQRSQQRARRAILVQLRSEVTKRRDRGRFELRHACKVAGDSLRFERAFDEAFGAPAGDARRWACQDDLSGIHGLREGADGSHPARVAELLTSFQCDVGHRAYRIELVLHWLNTTRTQAFASRYFALARSAAGRRRPARRRTTRRSAT